VIGIFAHQSAPVTVKIAQRNFFGRHKIPSWFPKIDAKNGARGGYADQRSSSRRSSSAFKRPATSSAIFGACLTGAFGNVFSAPVFYAWPRPSGQEEGADAVAVKETLAGPLVGRGFFNGTVMPRP
jgi:hypothetical protein